MNYQFVYPLFLFLPFSTLVWSKNAPLTLLNDPLARCMDGSLGGYYYQAATDQSKILGWILDMEGGGECVTSKRCVPISKTSLGSSKHFSASFSFTNHALLDDNHKTNPDFYDWNHVYLPYCSQDLWNGQRVSRDTETFNLYFSGHKIFKAILDDLDKRYALDQATTIILTGESAGGFGVYSNLDWLQQRYNHAKVVGAPIAGYEFYAYPYMGPGHTGSTLADFRPEAWPQHINLWNSSLNTGCLSAHKLDPWACELPAYSYEYVQTPLFIIEAQSDSVVLTGHNWVPSQHTSAPILAYFKEFHANQTTSLTKAMSSSSVHGVYNPACYIHTGFTNSILLDGKNYREAFGDWLLRGKIVKLQDNCGELCNPTCPH